MITEKVLNDSVSTVNNIIKTLENYKRVFGDCIIRVQNMGEYTSESADRIIHDINTIDKILENAADDAKKRQEKILKGYKSDELKKLNLIINKLGKKKLKSIEEMINRIVNH